MTDFNRNQSHGTEPAAPPSGTDLSGNSDGSDTAPLAVRCSRCANLVLPDDKYRCPICKCFLPGNPGATKPAVPARDTFDDWADQLVGARGGINAISIPDRLAIDIYIRSWRTYDDGSKQLAKIGAHSDDGKQLVATLKILRDQIDSLAEQLGINTSPVPVRQPDPENLAALTSGELAEQLEQLTDRARDLQLAEALRAAGDFPSESPDSPALLCDEGAGVDTLPASGTPGSGAAAAVSAAPRASDPEMQRLLDGNTPEGRAAHQREADAEATRVMYRTLGRRSPYLGQ